MMEKEILKYNAIINDDGKINDVILITREQEKLLLWLSDKEYLDNDYCSFCKELSVNDVTDLT